MDTARARILVLEDSVLVAMAVEDELIDRGYAVSLAATVAAAEMLAGTDHFAAALLDLHLPDGSPVALASRLARGGCRIAVVSGSDLDGVPPALAGHALFQKPVMPARLADWVDAILR